MSPCHLPPKDKGAMGKAVGKELVKRHGKKRFYSTDQVRGVATDLGYPIDWHCWAMAVFVSPGDFNAFHESIGEACDLGSMKAQMVSAITDGASADWFNVDLSWFDWPDIDFGSLFDVFDWSP